MPRASRSSAAWCRRESSISTLVEPAAQGEEASAARVAEGSVAAGSAASKTPRARKVRSRFILDPHYYQFWIEGVHWWKWFGGGRGPLQASPMHQLFSKMPPYFTASRSVR